MTPADALNLEGVELARQRRFTEAEACFRRLIEEAPDMCAAWSNLGYVLRYQRQLPESAACLQQALRLDPDHLGALENYALTLMDARQSAQAEAVLRHGMALHPAHVQMGFTLAGLLLRHGFYAEAWPLYELRSRLRVDLVQEFGFPEWQGEDLRGRSIVICHEQGYGDAIMCMRYLPLLRARGAASIHIICQSALHGLFEDAGLADHVIPLTDGYAVVPGCDYWVRMMSLPYRLGTTLQTIPPTHGLLRAHPARVAHWTPLLDDWWRRAPGAAGLQAPARALRVGLVWKGSAAHMNDADRSMASIALLAPLWGVPHVQFVSLQKDRDEQVGGQPGEPAGAAQPLLELGAQIRDFADTAAIISALDLVICVDTAVGHLAGALGVPCWLMLPHFGGDWRWMDTGERSAWYPRTLRLFRQPQVGTWPALVDEVARALHEFATGRAAQAGPSAPARPGGG